MIEASPFPKRAAFGALATVALLLAGCSNHTDASPEPSKPVATSPAAKPQSHPTKYPIGYDVSWAQCNTTLPAVGAFAVIQITGGRADKMSPCFAEQVDWSNEKLTGTPTQPKAQYYIWPANPGKNYRGQAIASWPAKGTNKYGDCTGSSGQACSYEYGIMRGRQALKFAAEQLGTKNLGTIYIDVESGIGDEPGTWQEDSSHNLAAIEGYEAAIRETGSKPGIYSNEQHLGTVLDDHDARALGDLVEWTTGSGTVEDAKSACDRPFIAGAKVALSQFQIAPQSLATASAIDLNYAC